MHSFSRSGHACVTAALCLSGLLPGAVSAQFMASTAVPADQDAVQLTPVVITTTPLGDQPLSTTASTHHAAQPIPAQDGADLLKTFPGFSVSRKGGADGEPVLRGQAGSRLDLLLDGESALGGCPHRMDPPTAYIFPAAYDRVTVLKGPETVLYGPGNSAGVVLFERDLHRFAAPGAGLAAGFTVASFGRDDESLTVRSGAPLGYAEVAANRSQSSDFRDGSGDLVHSSYERSSLRAAAGWTPDDDTLLELSATRSEGHAAYGYSMMDATRLDRDNLGLRFRRRNLSSLVTALEAQVYTNFIDHVMDNYSLRAFVPSMMMPAPSASNPDHRLMGGRTEVDLALDDTTGLKLGGDFLLGRHRSRSTGNQSTLPYQTLARTPDAKIDDYGAFAELTRRLASAQRVIAGARLDAWSAEDQRSAIAGMMSSSPNPTAGRVRSETHPAGFARYERDLQSLPATFYVGVGYTERAPDYWELITNESTTTKSSFLVRPEKTTQLDTGLNFRRGSLTASVAAFYNEVSDFLLVQSNFPKTTMSMGGMMGMGGMTTSLVTVTRNVDTASWGGEASLGYTPDRHWKYDASLAFVQGRNRTDGLPLAQQPPLEGRLGVAYAESRWSVGGLARFVAAQHRVAVDQGTIIGQDLGPTPGFAVYSINAVWRLTDRTLLSAGVDNLFDRTYAEHLSRNGGAVTGYPVTTRINEPGRTLWLKLDRTF